MSEQAGKLFQNVIWPAAAGNVAWSFFTLAIQEGIHLGTASQLCVLGLLAVYLAADWLQTERLSSTRTLKPYFWIADGALAAAIVTFAIAIQLKPLPECQQFLTVLLAIVFLAAAVGHAFGAWESAGSRNMLERWTLATANVTGLLVLIARRAFPPESGSWHLPLAVLVTLVAWAIARNWLKSKGR